jgi:hypothetical protein
LVKFIRVGRGIGEGGPHLGKQVYTTGKEVLLHGQNLLLGGIDHTIQPGRGQADNAVIFLLGGANALIEEACDCLMAHAKSLIASENSCSTFLSTALKHHAKTGRLPSRDDAPLGAAWCSPASQGGAFSLIACSSI